MRIGDGTPLTPRDLIDLPPAWATLAGAIMWLLARHLPVFDFNGPDWRLAGIALIVAGLILMAWSAVHFWMARTTVIPRRNASALVTDGPYRFSRNPIYLGDAMALVGWGLFLGALSAFVVLPGFVMLINRRFIRGEEAALKAAFPDEFAAFARRTRRWI